MIGDVLTLRDEDLIGRRQTRHTYRHPHDPALVLKIQTCFLPQRKRWYERPANIRPSIQRELEGYADLLIRLGRHEPFISRVHGLAQTNIGTAILAENVTFGCRSHAIVLDLLKHATPHDFSREDVAWAGLEYARITDLLLKAGICNQCQRPENVMLCRLEDGSICLRMFDFKTPAGRTLIPSRAIPGARLRIQRAVVTSTLRKFDAWQPAS